MKKVLAFVLVLAMVLGSVAMAFAVEYSDVKAGDDYEEAIGTLSELGVLNGYEDGTFKADRTIKRSEFCKVVIEALGLKPSAASATQFSDVVAGKWYVPYVALAAQLGIVNGYGDGTFRPEQTITDTQAIVMVVRALGYTDDYFGGYNAAKYISQATALGIMTDVNAGTGASTRGNVAQLVFNSLRKDIVTIDKDGNASRKIGGDSMMQRLAGTPYNTNAAGEAQPFVYGDPAMASAAAGKNLKAYLGKYVTAVQNSNGELTGVSTVVSKTLVGTFDGNSTFKTTDGTSYTVRTGVATNAGIFLFDNGEYNTTGAITTAAGATLEVAISGVYLTAIYSQSTWTPTATFQFEKDDLDTDKATLDAGAYAFATNNMAKIDESSFEIVGVDKLADIAVDNIVTVYVGPSGKITKLEVGTKTVEGQVTEITSAGKYVVNGTKYDVSGTAPELGAKGTFLLDYDGAIYATKAAEAAATNYLYGVLLQLADGSTGIYTADPKVQLVTADASTTVYVGDATAAPSAAWTTTAKGLGTDVAVKYVLNDKGQIHGLAAFDGEITADTQKYVAKDGVVTFAATSYKMDAETKVLVKSAAGKYAVGKAADYFGTTATFAAMAVKGTKVTFAIVAGSAADAASGNYAMYTGYTEKYAASGNYVELSVLEAGAAKNYKDADATFATTTAVSSTAGLYNFTVDTTGEVTSFSAVAAGKSVVSGTGYTTKTAVENGFVVTDSPAENIQIASDVVVYVWKSNAWTVGSVTDLAVGTGYTLNFYETKSASLGYDVVTVAK